MRLTIVLTVYNKERYLCRIFDALFNQKNVGVDDYEVLVVNDGSTDGSAKVINEFEKKQSHVRVLTQSNQGLSMARNNGVDEARGEYVWFVDADDTVSSNAVFLICNATESNPDIIPIYAKTEGIDKVRNAIPREAKTGKDVLLSEQWQQCGVFYVYRKSFLKDNNLHFLPGIYHEDAEFTPRMLYSAKTVKVIPEVLYTVYRDPDGITQVPRAKRAFDYLTASERLSKFVLDKGEEMTKVGEAIANSIAQDINNAFFIICKNSVDEQRELNKRFYLSRQLLLRLLSIAQQKKYRIEAMVFRFFPYKYVSIYKLMQLFNR
jgi:glycosyltransferase involved in cell wall biosynthesis